MLRDKSLHELRAIAQGYGIEDLFSKDAKQLTQDIELKQVAMIPEPAIVIPRPEYDARLMTKPPAKHSNVDDLMDLLKPYIERGMRFKLVDEETWEMACGKVTDTGSLRMPLRVILGCAAKVMR